VYNNTQKTDLSGIKITSRYKEKITTSSFKLEKRMSSKQVNASQRISEKKKVKHYERNADIQLNKEMY
jgi:hypothetical protein